MFNAIRPLSFLILINTIVFLVNSAWASEGEALLATGLVTIAVIDTGLDIRHEHVRPYLWRNPGESGVDENGVSRSTNGIDDDGNGYIDDVYGWNFFDNNSNIEDNDGHGTHVSGVIRQTVGEKAPDAQFRILPIKYYDSKSNRAGSGKAFVKALRYALDMKADIINISGGGHAYSEKERQLLKEAHERNIIVVAAAGNKRPKSKDRPFYPAAYNLPNILSVVGTDGHGSVLPTSNLIDSKSNLFSIGYNLLSSLPGNKFGYKTGSSQAAAVITGRVVIQFALNESLKVSRFAGLDLESLADNAVTMNTKNVHNP